MKKMRIPWLIILSAFLFLGMRSKTYTHLFIAKISSVDTVLLLKAKSRVKIPEENFMSLRVNLQIKQKIEGKYQGISKFIIIQLAGGEHLCNYDFAVGKTYKIHAKSIKFKSD